MMLGKATANLLKIPLICKFFVIGAEDNKAGMLKKAWVRVWRTHAF